MIAGDQFHGSISTGALMPAPATPVPLRGRLVAARRRLILGLRDWLAIGVIACFSLTLFAVTFFSLLSR